MPYNYPHNCVVYTGTHDNQTLYAWYDELADADREYLDEYLQLRGKSREEIANKSVTETFSRSILTSVTTFVAILILFVMGVSSIREFTLPLMVGTICGTYSSVAIATSLWYVLEKRADAKKAEAKAAEKAAKAAPKAAPSKASKSSK